MILWALVAFLVVISSLTWLSFRQRQRSIGCCAPADPREDLRMRVVRDEDADSRSPRPPMQ